MARYTDIDAILSKLPDDLPYKDSVKRVLMQAPEADVISLPCKVGDEVWAIKTYNNGKRMPMQGTVHEIYFIDKRMTPCIVVKSITRGKWGEKVFATFEEAERACELL